MRDPLPESIDPRWLISSGGQLAGYWPASECRRVQAIAQRLLSDVSVEFALHDIRRCIKLDGHIRGLLELGCQRCLRSMQWILDEPLKLYLVPPNSEVVADGQYELLELNEHGCIDTAQWIEDEVILRIPSVPVHIRTQDCDPDTLKRAREYDPATEAGDYQQDNPFRILKDWKDGHH